ncbi:crotonase/enoyl-CoA hydratase family protein [Verminephrobacter eiseniae]|uniref:crotonase/enoyl-CoA hydratase family protein n=1 Tax=Verminephrobacter eiseniae TaxID=364317 RepID=UPI0022370B03|nr:crotonase/enoyl-CoA hydratase family protein [Verminephrobacter eiseniae]MCW5260158.1 crotonase/enoyl-CoA hydratase family protein [Verminephrobacter eiseniae]
MTVLVQTRHRVTLVTLHRPDRRNAVDAATAQALHAAFLAFEQDDAADVAVLHGAGGHFCAGWDLQSGARLQAQGVTPEALADTLDFEADSANPPGPMGPSRLQLSKPVIAAISGAAVAGGMELALWCDLRVMEEDAYFGIFCRRFGVPLIDGGTVRLPRLIGLSQALDLILTGRKVESAEALRIGLCNRVVPSGQALEAALALAQELAAFPQATLRADRASALAAQGLPVPQALLQEWATGRHCLAQALHGASHFSSGQGRHGQF